MSFGTEGWGLVAIAGASSFLANIFYMWGGTEGFGLFWRRFIGSAVLATAANGVALFLGTWAWQFLLIYPFLCIGFSLGYGGDNVFTKVIKRTIFALGVVSSCIAGLWATGFTFGGWIVTGLAVLTGLTSVVLGVTNPFHSAVAEQFLISQVLTMYIPFWGYVGGK